MSDEYQEEDQTKKKLTLGGCFLWGMGGLFIFGSVAMLATSPLAAPGYLIAGLLMFPPTFAYIQRKSKFEISTGIRVVVVLVGLGLAGLGLPKGELAASKAGATATRTAVTAAPPAKAKLVFLTETCSEMSRQFGPQSKLSDLQKEELWKQYRGKAFKWSLKVTEVSSDLLGGFTVQYKCGVDSPSLIQDVQVKYEDSRKSAVMGLMKGSTYEIKGRLKMSSSLLGMTADDIP